MSRVGGAAQTKIMKKLSGGIRTALAQYRELAAFAQFSSDLDDATRTQLNHGQKVTELMKQKQYSPLSVAEQSLILFAVEKGAIDEIEIEKISDYQNDLVSFAKSNYAEFMNKLNTEGLYDDNIVATLSEILEKFAEVH